jgi:hypothetical protein
MEQFTTTTLGTWKNNDGRELVATLRNEHSIRVSRNDGTNPEVMTEEQWLALYDILRDNGFTHAGSSGPMTGRREK